LGQLRYELATDKPYRKLTDSGEDVQLWNEAYEESVKAFGEDNASWFKGPWLFAECYMYRRVREAMLLCSSSLRDYDPFEQSKIESHESNAKSVFQLISSICPVDFAEEKNNSQLMHRRFQVIMEVIEICLLCLVKLIHLK
jgi:hypothetical protein